MRLNPSQDEFYMRLACRLARRAYGATSPNPMVGAVLVKNGRIIGQGWHHRAGGAHAEIEALTSAKGSIKGATLYVTLEPCSTQGRTPPCTNAIIAAGIRRVVVGATDPNPLHRGKGFKLIKRAGISITHGVCARLCEQLNDAYNHWIVHRTPFVTVKAALTMDGKIATASGESKWITGEKSRAFGMKLRQGADAILVGINTVLADDPSLTWRKDATSHRSRAGDGHQLERIILDSLARTPLEAQILNDDHAELTTIVVGPFAPRARVAGLMKRVRVLVAPHQLPVRGTPLPQINLPWLLHRLGAENVTSLLVEGGGEVNASFLLQGLAQRVAFFYAPKVIGGRHARPAVAGLGVDKLAQAIRLSEVEWKRLGQDLLLTARVERPDPKPEGRGKK